MIRPTLIQRLLIALGLATSPSAAVAQELQILTRQDVVMVSQEAFDSADDHDIVNSNIDVLNALRAEYLSTDEISRDALTSYYVDYYLAQMNNGGFAQFVFNSGWAPELVGLVRSGLNAIGAKGSAQLFEEGAKAVDALGAERLQAFLGSQYFGENDARDELHAISLRFFKLADKEDLTALNAKWLKSRPGLLVLPQDRLDAEVRRRASAVPDLEQRKAKAAKYAAENAPRYAKLIDALCKQAGLNLDRITAGSFGLAFDGENLREIPPDELNAQPPGELQMAWYFLTDKGLHFMVEANGKAAIYEDATKTRIASMTAPQEF